MAVSAILSRRGSRFLSTAPIRNFFPRFIDPNDDIAHQMLSEKASSVA